MKKLEYEVRFLTPAFLGNAQQNGQWRTPPFKALLRHWWRVAYAAEHGFADQTAEMRREEGLLFGNTWLSHRSGNTEIKDHRKSLVRIRLDSWEEGKLKSWQGMEQAPVYHPETEKTGNKVRPHAYLGYGPLDGRGNTKLDKKRYAAIQAGESGSLFIVLPSDDKDTERRRLLETNTPRIEHALWLLDKYGALGGRSRNGWGSFSLIPYRGTPALGGNAPLQPWRQALRLDWPNSIGSDEKGALIWITKPFSDWQHLMRELAIIKIGLRTQFVFSKVKPPHQLVEPRHYLSYPITTHSTREWNKGTRLPNSLRFKIRRYPKDPSKLVGVIAHVPCCPSEELKHNKKILLATWQAVHALLDELTREVPSRSYPSIFDPDRKEKLIPGLNGVGLLRFQE